MDITKKLNSLLNELYSSERGSGQYRLLGPWFEVVYPLFRKYIPEKLKSYECLLWEPVELFNQEIARLVDKGSESKNLNAGYRYYKQMISIYATPETVHQIDDPRTEDTLAYIPNQYVDQSDYWGRED